MKNEEEMLKDMVDNEEIVPERRKKEILKMEEEVPETNKQIEPP